MDARAYSVTALHHTGKNESSHEKYTLLCRGFSRSKQFWIRRADNPSGTGNPPGRQEKIEVLPRGYMPLTRKQAWRRMRVRLEPAESNDKASARGKRPSSVTLHFPPNLLWHRWTPGQPPKRPGKDRLPPNRHGGIHSPQRDTALANRRPTKQARDSSSKRQAETSFIRVGSRVSFNTVVAAILIPSAKDLHHAARHELWWQETDYQYFRINFIKFMRSPPNLANSPEEVPVDIAAESCESSADKGNQKKGTQDLQPAVIDSVMYENAPPGPQAMMKKPCVREWATRGQEDGVDNGGVVLEQRRKSVSESWSSAASAAAIEDKTVAGADTIVFTPGAETPPVTPQTPPVAVTKSGDSSNIDTSSTVVTSLPPYSTRFDSVDYGVDNRNDSDDITEDGTSWEDDQKKIVRLGPCLSWDSTDCEDGNIDSDNVRVRRSFSDQDSLRNKSGCARQDRGIAEGVAAAAAASFKKEDVNGDRPRAFSLDGWFTCCLQSGVEAKSYDTYNRAERLRDLVKLSPIGRI